MINALLSGIINLIIGLVNIILSPIDSMITTLLPDLSTAFSSIGGFLNLATQSIGWVISLTGISRTAISLIIMYYGFKLTVPLVFYFIKLALSWYNKLKP